MIPKVIHQIWIGPNPVPEYWTNTWSQYYLEKNPEYQYKLWDNDNYLKELNKYPILKIFYEQLEFYCLKADLLRLIILYEYGGIFIDADSVWINNKSLDTLIIESGTTNLFIGRTPNTDKNDSNYYLTNGVIGVSQGNPLIMNCIKHCQDSIFNWYRRDYDPKLVKKKNLESSRHIGPGLITRQLRDKPITILPSEYFYPVLWHGIDIQEIDYTKYAHSYMFQFGGTTNRLMASSKIRFYWINLDRSHSRRKHMYELFSKKLFLNQRVMAYDGDKLYEYPELSFNGFDNISKYEYGCSFSHLKAIKTCYDNGETCGIICEDDLCLDYMSKWELGIEQIIQQAPSDWQIIKIHCNYTKHINKLIKRKQKIGYFSPWENRSVSTLAYIINLSGMTKLLNKYYLNEQFCLMDDVSSKADVFIYQTVKTYDYTLPLVNHLCDKSHINSNQESTHQEGAQTIDNYFRNK